MNNNRDVSKEIEENLKKHANKKQDTIKSILELDDKMKSSNLDIYENKINLFLNIPIDVTLELGRTRITVNDLIKLNENTVIPLDKKTNEPLNIMANGHLIAYGEIVTMGDQYGIKIIDIAEYPDSISKAQK